MYNSFLMMPIYYYKIIHHELSVQIDIQFYEIMTKKTNWSHASEEIREVTQTCITIIFFKLSSLDKPDKNI